MSENTLVACQKVLRSLLFCKIVKCAHAIVGVGTVLNVAERMTPKVEPPPWYIIQLFPGGWNIGSTHTSESEK